MPVGYASPPGAVKNKTTEQPLFVRHHAIDAREIIIRRVSYSEISGEVG